jgi:dTMP kinase
MFSDSKEEHWYRARVLKYAKLLHYQYGGDIDLICAVVFLKGLQTRFFEYSDQTSINAVKIREILQDIDFPALKSEWVLNHLQNYNAQRNPILIEEKIINDAFTLGSLGVAGLVRFFMWMNYSNQGPEIFLTIDQLFKKRLNSLITPQAIRLAEKENRFIYLFSELLREEPFIDPSYPGKYIIIEGNSGTGKDKQADLLKAYFEGKGARVAMVFEPSKIYREFESFVEDATQTDLTDSAPLFRLYSIIGDRYSQIHEKVAKDLKEGKIVISVRSYISMLVYQCETDFERLLVNFIHRFVPKPDVAIIYDAEEAICLQRVLSRGSKLTPFDKVESLKKYRPIYMTIAKSSFFDFPIEVVDASGTIESVAEETKKVIEKYL